MNTTNNWKTFFAFTLRVIIVHMATYFLFGIIMSNVFDYGEIFKREIIRDYMLPMDEHNVILGPFLQPIRGLNIRNRAVANSRFADRKETRLAHPMGIARHHWDTFHACCCACFD